MNPMKVLAGCGEAGVIVLDDEKLYEKLVILRYNGTINKETCITFSNMINELPKQAGLVFRLHKVDGLTYKQISEVLELSIKTVENHKKWIDAAAFLGCHSIRVNARSRGEYEEQQKFAADGLRRLCEYGDTKKINVIVENHGGISSNGEWLAGVMKMVDHKRVGTLPDFGNFTIDHKTGEVYDRYKGMEELMPFAKGVSAKSNVFDAEGNERNMDYYRIMNIVKDSGYKGFVGIEYEGPFDYLDAPVARIQTANVPIPFSPILEKAILPAPERIVDAVLGMKEIW